MVLSHIKAIMFDIGGVVLNSPFVAIAEYEREKNLPPNYLNVSIASRGPNGAWQRFERGEIPLHEFYATFSKDLSDVDSGNEWFRRYCLRKGLNDEVELPAYLDIDGRDLFGRMMRKGASYDVHIVTAIRKLRETGKWRIIALTNNFGAHIIGTGPVENEYRHKNQHQPQASSIAGISDSELRFLGWQDGPVPSGVRALFHNFFDSSEIGLRKPDPEFYLHACRESGIHPHEVIFLDDIGRNLKTAKELGMTTIHVPIGGTREVVKQLEEMLGIDLSVSNHGHRHDGDDDDGSDLAKL
ncbi:HAD-like protein [Pisolithus croceorrhizus]|nr:HAD-like protein [Pisolithus croceorrhizus]KAI6164348.1 HAD-like protein [Pisolithus thermaeus]